MHILVVTQYFWPENFRINDIVSGLHERGHQVTVLTGHPNYPTGTFTHGYNGRKVIREQYEGIQVIRIPMLPRGQNSGLKLGLNYLSFALIGSVLGPWLAHDHYDAIFVYEPSPMTVGFPAMAISAKTRRPILFYIQDLWPESLQATGFIRNPLLLEAVRLMVEYIYRSCSLILVTSRAFIPRVQALKVERERIHYFPQYAESFYKPESPDENWASSRMMPTGFKILFAGNMGKAQDLFTVLEAAAMTRLDDIEWVFLGDGSARAELQSKVAELKLKNVSFLGSYPASEMPKYFAQAEVLLVSLTADDLFSLTIPAKVQSYLACGRPILASLNGEGAAIILEADAGLVVLPENADSLAKAALELKNMSSVKREELGRNGRLYYEQHFERESLLSEIEGLFTKVGSGA